VEGIDKDSEKHMNPFDYQFNTREINCFIEMVFNQSLILMFKFSLGEKDDYQDKNDLSFDRRGYCYYRIDCGPAQFEWRQ
jgi:hypothetical protein